MARDKLITVRIEGEKREAFNEWAKSKNLDTSALLYEFIEACLAGRINEGILKNDRIDTKQLDQLVAERVDSQIDSRIENALVDLRVELQPLLDAHYEIEFSQGKLIA